MKNLHFKSRIGDSPTPKNPELGHVKDLAAAAGVAVISALVLAGAFIGFKPDPVEQLRPTADTKELVTNGESASYVIVEKEDTSSSNPQRSN